MDQNSRWQYIINFIRHDFGRKFVALLLATLLYSVIAPRAAEKVESQVFSNIRLDLTLPENVVLSNGPTIPISINVGARQKEILDKIDPYALCIRADISDKQITPGKPYRVYLRESDVQGLPRNVKIQSIMPQSVVVGIETLGRKHLPIRARYDSLNKLNDDYEVSDVKFVPASVLVSGPIKELDRLDAVYSEPIPIDGNVSDSFTWRCTLRKVPGINYSITEADAQVEVHKVLTTHTFRAVPLLIIQSAERTRKFQVTGLEPANVNVVISGPRGTLARMHSREISASINLDNINKPGVYTLPVSITVTNPSKGVTVKKFQPLTAKVTVKQE